MATTHDFNLTRNELIEVAFAKIGVIQFGRILTANQLAEGIQALNLIIREEDLKGTGMSKNLWALDERTIPLAAGSYVYGTDNQLRPDILDIFNVYYRNTSGDDYPVDIVSAGHYDAIGNKNETGDVQEVYLKVHKTLASQLLYVWPVPASVSTTSEVTGTDGENYRCIMGHTSAAINRPITGNSWRLYWDIGLDASAGGAGSTWVTATAYTNGELLRYGFKRPLADFDNASDTADLPQGWDRYLMWRLAHDLAPSYHVPLDERLWIKSEYLQAREEIFPSTKSQGQDFHNKGLFY
jgi:hypothetical protein